MKWMNLTESGQLDDIIKLSSDKPQVIFKHSTRCSISMMAKSRLERDLPLPGADFYYLDLLQYRPISVLIAEKFNVVHESPQILLIKNGICVFYESHNAIDVQEIASHL